MSVGVSFGDRNPLRSNTEKNEEKKKGGKEKRRNLELRQMKKKINRGNHQSFNNHREIPNESVRGFVLEITDKTSRKSKSLKRGNDNGHIY